MGNERGVRNRLIGSQVEASYNQKVEVVEVSFLQHTRDLKLDSINRLFQFPMEGEVTGTFALEAPSTNDWL